MDKKAKSKPMVAILNRLNLNGDFEIIDFGDALVLNQPIEAWPHVDCLISFYSDGFPLDKAVEYVKLSKERNRNFLSLNDLQQQYVLLDRRLVYRTLSEEIIPVTKYIEVSRDTEDEETKGDDPEGFVETEDSVSINGLTINKPFVEKPVNGEDHNVWIYYPGGITGGGVKKLFRKIKNKSSEFYPDHPGDVRKEGSYIYERFQQTGGTDVKVYTVGPHYAHAEARKSPVVDGYVERFPDGKEIRYPVLLTPAEKEIAKKINIAFGQFVCGFDLLRSEGKSYVCDVNGWSFVKNSQKYYKDAADVMRQHILHHFRGSVQSNNSSLPDSSVPISINTHPSHPDSSHDDMTGSPNYFDLMHQNLPMFMRGERSSSYEDLLKPKNRWHKSRHELRAIIAVIRHGDRTPKQKMKVKVTQKPLLDLMTKCGGGYFDGKLKQAKLKRPEELQDLLNIIRQILKENQGSQSNPLGGEGCSDDEDEERDEFLHRMKLARTILERGGKFSGINRKVQLKPLQVKFNTNAADTKNEDKKEVEVVEALMIIKHGGILTEQGKKQSEELGARFRKQMYPQVKGGGGDGLLRLHSTYRHDLKIYSSDEGRVQVSAAAFAKGLLDLEGNSLVPIMISLVNKDQQILDAFGKGVDETMQKVKIKLQCAITGGISKMILPKFAKEYSKKSSTMEVVTLAQSPIKPSKDVKKVQVECKADQATEVRGLPENSIEILEEIFTLLKGLCDSMLEKLKREGVDYDEQEEDQNQENNKVMDYERWKDLMHQFCKRGKFNISMITEIYDSAKYDLIQMMKNKKEEDEGGEEMKMDLDRTSSGHVGGGHHDDDDSKDFIDFGLLKSVYQLSKKMADIVVPNEYGISSEERWDIGSRICSELLGKLCRDFSFMRQQSLEEELEIEELEEEDGELGGHSTRITHRLAVEYAEANQIKTPERHVRTRIYFTSESHIHALINVLRYGPKSLISPSGLELLQNCQEFDYLSQVLFRVFENFDELPEDPKRFTLEILFSPGSTGEPCEPITLGFIPCDELDSIGDGTLSELEELIFPYATHKRKESKFGNQISFSKRQGL